MKRKRFIQYVGVLLAVWIGVSGAAAGPERGKLIVKITVEGAKILEIARRETGAILVERIPEGRLKRVCKQYGVSVWEPLFPRRQGRESNGLGRTYRLRFDPSMDVSQVARDFKDLPGWVEYAEPDRRMEVQEDAPRLF